MCQHTFINLVNREKYKHFQKTLNIGRTFYTFKCCWRWKQMYFDVLIFLNIISFAQSWSLCSVGRKHRYVTVLLSLCCIQFYNLCEYNLFLFFWAIIQVRLSNIYFGSWIYEVRLAILVLYVLRSRCILHSIHHFPPSPVVVVILCSFLFVLFFFDWWLCSVLEAINQIYNLSGFLLCYIVLLSVVKQFFSAV